MLFDLGLVEADPVSVGPKSFMNSARCWLMKSSIFKTELLVLLSLIWSLSDLVGNGSC